MTLFEIISLTLNLLFGAGMFISLITLRSIRVKASAEGKHAKHEAQRKEVDLVNDLQCSNDLLSQKLNELLQEVVAVKMQNKDLQINVNNLTIENKQLRKEVADLNQKFENVKTITRTK